MRHAAGQITQQRVHGRGPRPGGAVHRVTHPDRSPDIARQVHFFIVSHHVTLGGGYNGQVASQPTLVVVSGPLGAGKTTLAHRLAGAVGCPAICRDEIKEGMAQSNCGSSTLPVVGHDHEPPERRRSPGEQVQHHAARAE